MQLSLDAIADVSQRMESFVAQRRSEAAPAGADAVDFVDVAASTLVGGKRMRASLCAMGWRAVAEAAGPTDPALPASVVAVAAALEVFHAAALVHDDIIDSSDTRRGRPSAHRTLESAHRARSWRGDAASHGRSAAILLGDLLVAWSDDLLEEGLVHAAPDAAAAARARFATMRREVTLGQYLDITEEAAFADSPDSEHLDRALRIAEYKSARYSVQQPLLIGASLAGADDRQTAALADFGLPVGLGFQLRDDVLGVFGDESITGKPAGDDLREGKRTALIAATRELVPPSVRTTIDELLGDPSLSAEQIASFQSTIRDSGALARVEELIAGYAKTADRALSGAPLGHRAVSTLRDLARAAVHRDA